MFCDNFSDKYTVGPMDLLKNKVCGLTNKTIEEVADGFIDAHKKMRDRKNFTL